MRQLLGRSQTLLEPSLPPPPPKYVHPPVRVGMVLVWAPHLPHGACGRWLQAQGTGGRKDPPSCPPPQARGVEDTAKAAQTPAWPGAENAGFQGWLWSEFWLLQAPPAAPGLARSRGPPKLGPSAPPNKRMWSQQRPRGAGSLLPGYPPGPLSHLVRGCRPQNRAKSRRTSLPGRWGGEGGGAGHFGISKADT